MNPDQKWFLGARNLFYQGQWMFSTHDVANIYGEREIAVQIKDPFFARDFFYNPIPRSGPKSRSMWGR